MSRAPGTSELALFAEAEALTTRAYAPYSGFAVGAVLVDDEGRRHHGVNVENAAYPVGICAERAALAALVTSGARRVTLAAVAAGPGRDCLPCGMCLQALAEHGAPDVVAQAGGEVRVYAFTELLAAPFAAGGVPPATPSAEGVGR